MLGTPGKVPSSQYEEVSHSELDYHGIVGLDLQEDTFAASPMLDNAMEASSVTEPATLLEEIIMITASGSEESPSLSTTADQAAQSGSNVEHLGSDDPQAAMVAGARQELIEEFKSDTLPLQAQEGLPLPSTSVAWSGGSAICQEGGKCYCGRFWGEGGGGEGDEDGDGHLEDDRGAEGLLRVSCCFVSE